MVREKFNIENIETKLDNALRVVEKLTQIGKALPPLVMSGGVAYLGAKAFNHPFGAVTGLVGLELAKSPSLIASGAGIGTLALLGLSTLEPDTENKESGLKQSSLGVEVLGNLGRGTSTSTLPNQAAENIFRIFSLLSQTRG